MLRGHEEKCGCIFISRVDRGSDLEPHRPLLAKEDVIEASSPSPQLRLLVRLETLQLQRRRRKSAPLSQMC